ncbi:hypothetical protein K3725_05780 [Leisingera sp. S132]|uniref:hypothetical protein n=1 Tax=Leisingera sp. S132 TaxID=2867016 RepID=UPI0021A58E8D|nr:hypothetical protein [Leisingera sp. S132]UWQ80513.1 hypothetical protein K3725_05780 [Leisingera sp. S132]
MKKLATILFLACGPASATELPYPPYEFSLYLSWGQIAVDVAKHCKTLAIDKEQYRVLEEENFQLLEREGFSRGNWRNEMEEVPVGIRDQVNFEFYFAYGIRTGTLESEWCHAGRQAMKKNKYLDQLLTEQWW